MASPLFRRPRITLIVVLLISLSLLSASYRGEPPAISSAKGLVRGVFTPLRQAATAVITPVYDVVAGAFEYGSVKRQNQQLQNEVALLKNRPYADAGAQAALSSLSAALKLTFAANIKSTPAQVISYTPSNLQLSVEINKGSHQGIRVGNPVVAAYGLVGRVVAVSADSSTVLLVDDPNFAAGVRIQPSQQLGLAVGQGSDRSLSVQLVDPGTTLKKGQVAYTSGLQGEIFPPGIPVGRVVDAYTPAGALEEHVDLQPVVDLARLYYVSVLDWLPAGAP
ncbi:MAG: rod shape-determining protein MreC [Actinomycetota bacterium]|nr:rod shape-determining protein MreC [Actinomycetota bacterium]